MASHAIEPATNAVIDVESNAQRPSGVDSVAAAAREVRRHSETSDFKVDSLRRITSAPVFQASTRIAPINPSPVVVSRRAKWLRSGPYSLTYCKAVNRYRGVNDFWSQHG